MFTQNEVLLYFSMHSYTYLHMHIFRGACKAVCKHTDRVTDNLKYDHSDNHTAHRLLGKSTLVLFFSLASQKRTE